MIYCFDTGDPRDRQLKRIFGLLTCVLHQMQLYCRFSYSITRFETYLTWPDGLLIQASAGLFIN